MRIDSFLLIVLRLKQTCVLEAPVCTLLLCGCLMYCSTAVGAFFVNEHLCLLCLRFEIHA